MFFHAGARAAPRFPAPFRTWPSEGFDLQSKETPAFFGMSGDIREISPQLLFFRRPGGRRGPPLPPGAPPACPSVRAFRRRSVSPLLCHFLHFGVDGIIIV